MTPFDDLLRRSWPVFLEAIRMRRTLTYTEFAGRVGPPLTRRHVHRQFLLPLGEFCRRERLPDLCALVVRKDTGQPGAGWFAMNGAVDEGVAWAEALDEVYSHPWPKSSPKVVGKANAHGNSP